jgi:hypothetical protein
MYSVWSSKETASKATHHPLPHPLPQLAGRLFYLALEALLELTAIRHGTKDASRLRCMRISVDPVDCCILARLAAPPVGVRDEEQLVLSEVLQARQVLRGLLCRSALPCLERCRESAGICDVLAQSETAIDVKRLAVRSRDGEVGILVNEAFGLCLEGFNRRVRPPVRVVAVLIVVTTCRVESVAELVACHRTKCAIGHVLRRFNIKHWSLHDTSWEAYLVAGGVVVCIDCWDSHAPFVAIHRLPERRPLILYTEAICGDDIVEESLRRDIERPVVVSKNCWIHDIRALGWVTNLLNDVVNFLDGLLRSAIIHPVGSFEFLRELRLDVSDDSVAELFGLSRKRLFNEEAAQNPTQDTVHVTDTRSPAFGGRIWVSSR